MMQSNPCVLPEPLAIRTDSLASSVELLTAQIIKAHPWTPMPSMMNAQSSPSFPHSDGPARVVTLPRPSAVSLNLTVFLAENDPGSRRALSAALGSIGCRVIEFSTGVEAIEAAADETPDAILLDARLPDTDAASALAELRADASTQAVPVVVIAASLLRDEEAACLDLGAHAFLTKPVNLDALYAAMAPLAHPPSA